MKKLFAFLGVALCLLSSCGSGTTSSYSVSDTQKSYTEEEIMLYCFAGIEKTQKIGEKSSYYFDVICNRVRKTKYLSTYARTENYYLIVNITLISNLRKETMLTSSNFAVWNNMIVKYDPCASEGAYLKEDAFIISQKMNYGLSKTFSVVFEVPNTNYQYMFVFQYAGVMHVVDLGEIESVEVYGTNEL